MYSYQMIGIADGNNRVYESKYGNYSKKYGFELSDLSKSMTKEELLNKLFHEDCWSLKKDIKNRRSKFKTELKAEKDGYIFIDAYKTGCAGVTLGVGRNKTTDSVCAEAGMILLKRTGDFVKKGETIMEVFGKNEESLETSLLQLKNAVTYQENPLKERKLIYETIN